MFGPSRAVLSRAYHRDAHGDAKGQETSAIGRRKASTGQSVVELTTGRNFATGYLDREDQRGTGAISEPWSSQQLQERMKNHKEDLRSNMILCATDETQAERA